MRAESPCGVSFLAPRFRESTRRPSAGWAATADALDRSRMAVGFLGVRVLCPLLPLWRRNGHVPALRSGAIPQSTRSQLQSVLQSVPVGDVIFDKYDRSGRPEGPHHCVHWMPRRSTRIAPVKPVRFGGCCMLAFSSMVTLPSARRTAAKAYSITSSARARTACGMLIPSVLAVLRLITSSNLVGSSTGKSEGFSPLRIRPT